LITNNLEITAECLRKGGIVAIPTETVYGLAANAFNGEAVLNIFELKKRPHFNPLIVHCKSIEQVKLCVSEIPPNALLLAEKFWPGPLTLILKKTPKIPDLVTAGKNTVAVRVPNHPTTLALLDLIDFPLAAPSANPFGSISPTTAKHVFDYFNDTLEFVLDGGPCINGIESTIIGFEHNTPILYRHGAIPLEEIESIIGKVQIQNQNDTSPQAPGMLSRHYAPQTATLLTEDLHAQLQHFSNHKIGVLVFKQRVQHPCISQQEILSPSGNLREAAKNLYAALHRLDSLKLNYILVEKMPPHGLGNSMNDRLQRAIQQ